MDRPRRIRALSVALLLVVAALGVQMALAAGPSSGPGTAPDDSGAYPGRTLITVQSFGWFDRNNGKALIVDRNGTVVWEYAPPGARVFDAERLDNGNVLAAVAEYVPADGCPEQYTDGRGPDHCVYNRVVELDYDSKEVVWEYSWYDEFIHWHEVHDVDRLSSGETAIADMGNDRAFTVDEDGEITWSWSAEKHLGPGSTFWDEYVPEDEEETYRRDGPESDWTHMNDIDRLENGNFQLSIRNFDVVVEVDPATNEIVDVVGRPGRTATMNEQHNPNRLDRWGTVLVADSENDRVVEIDAETGERVWIYEGSRQALQWPRDADRLPNGNTLIVDSRNFRVLEVNPNGTVVWEYSLAGQRGIVYDADRLGLPEEPDEVPPGWDLDRRVRAGVLGDFVATVEGWAGFIFPPWVGASELITILVGLVLAGALAVDGVLFWRGRSGESR